MSEGFKRIVVPNDFMGQIAVILKDAGADTRSQSTSLAKIEELIRSNEDFDESRSFTVTEPTKDNTNVVATGTSKVPLHSEIPEKK